MSRLDLPRVGDRSDIDWYRATIADLAATLVPAFTERWVKASLNPAALTVRRMIFPLTCFSTDYPSFTCAVLTSWVTQGFRAPRAAPSGQCAARLRTSICGSRLYVSVCSHHLSQTGLLLLLLWESAVLTHSVCLHRGQCCCFWRCC